MIKIKYALQSSKCHLFLSLFNILNILLWKEALANIFSYDSIFTFEKHINEFCKKRYRNLHALVRCTKYVSTEKRRTLFKAFAVSQFNYCPLVRMFHTKESYDRINSLHEKALKLTCPNRNLSFDEFLKLDKSVSIHYRNLYFLTEIYIMLKWDCLHQL